MREWKLLLGGASLGFVVRGILMAVGLGITALLTRLLDEVEFGGFQLALNAAGVLAMVGLLGTNTGLQRMLPVARERGGAAAVRRTWSSAGWVVAAGMAAVAAVAALLWQPLVVEGLGAAELAGMAGLVALLAAAQGFEELASVYFRSTGRPRLGLLLLNLPRQAAFLLVLALLLVAGGPLRLGEAVGLRTLVAGSAALVGLGLALRAGRRAPPSPVEDASAAPGPRGVAGQSWPMLGHAVAATLLGAVDLWYLRKLVGGAEVGVYGAVLQLSALLTMLLSVVNLVLPPMLAGMYEQGRTAQMEAVLRRVATLAGWAALLVWVFFALFGRPLLGFAFGPRFEAGHLPLLLLAGGQVFNVFVGSPGWLLQMTGHQGFLLKLTAGCLGFKLVLGWWVVGAAGMDGAAALTAAIILVQNLLLVGAARRLTGIRTYAHPLLTRSHFR